MSETKVVGAATGALGIGAVAGFSMDPAKGLELLKWLNTSLGPVGFVAAIGAAVAVATNWFFWKRLKEKDQECQAEMDRQRAAWKAVVDGKEADNKEIAKTVTDLLVQVTLLAERARVTNAPTRSN